MYVTVVNFQLKGMSHQEFMKDCEKIAPVFADIPGLITKVWLSDPAKNTYGGVYTWADKSSFDGFTRTQLAKDIMGHPNFAAMTVKDFGVLEAPTRVTRGLR
jgi:hypothetical protein